MNGGEVSVIGTQERWDKTNAVLDRIWEEFVLLKATRESPIPEEDAITAMRQKNGTRPWFYHLCGSNLPSHGAIFEGYPFDIGWIGCATAHNKGNLI
jgi:hypothetical protein